MPKSLPSHFLIAAVFAAVALLSGCVTTGGTRIDNVPMYGQPALERPKALKRADEEFIKQASEGLGGREKASVAWWMEGDKYMREGNLDYAMRRYNQSWLLNPNSFRPYWGFGRVLLEQGQLDESIKHLEKANQLVDDEYQKVALLTDTASVYSVKANNSANGTSERAKYFSLANRYFEEKLQAWPNVSELLAQLGTLSVFRRPLCRSVAKGKCRPVTGRSIPTAVHQSAWREDARAKMKSPRANFIVRHH